MLSPLSALFAYTCLYIDAPLRNFLVRISFLRGLLGIVVCAGLNKTALTLTVCLMAFCILTWLMMILMNLNLKR